MKNLEGIMTITLIVACFICVFIVMQKQNTGSNIQNKKGWTDFTVECKKNQNAIQNNLDGKHNFDTLNYFEGNKKDVIKQLDNCNSEDYYQIKRLGCPKCGSYRIMPDHNRDRGVVLGYKCKDCGYIWKRK